MPVPAQLGRVSLVGAGPGDPDLLTVKALKVIERADVVLFDELVSAAVLDLTRATARRLHVGKRGYRGGMRQDAINALMVRLARRGLHVVRLKAGDPMVFGRAGEEIAILEAAGIPVDVVPGVTAALALASATRTSLTRRDAASAVTFVTGQTRDGELPRELATGDPATTLVVYMGSRQASALRAVLLAAGRAPTTPVSLVAGASREDEQQWHGCLDDLERGTAGLAGDAPIVMGIGAVFAGAANRASALSRAQPDIDNARASATGQLSGTADRPVPTRARRAVRRHAGPGEPTGV